MKPIMITNLLEFLEYMAKVEIGPASGLPYYNVTFTVSEIRAAVREMIEDSELYQRFQQEQLAQETDGNEQCKAFARLGVVFFLTADECAQMSTRSNDAYHFIAKKVLLGDFSLEGDAYFPGGLLACEGEFCPDEDLNFDFPRDGSISSLTD